KVLSALDERARQRARRPLLVFGVVRPALPLAVMAAYAWNMFHTVMEDSNERMVERALESSHFAARFVAEAVARQINHRWLTLEQAASQPRLREMIQRKAAGDANVDAELQDWIDNLALRH